MSVVKTVAASVLAWVAMGTLAQADPLPWSSGLMFKWTSWGPDGQVVQNSSAPASSTPTDSSTPPAAPSPSASIQTASAPSVSLAATSVPATPPSTPAPPSPASYDAYLNFSGGPYPSADQLVSGTAQPWYSSPTVQHVFGGTPTPQQQQDFTQAVLQDVQKTFALAGLSPQLTLDPNAHANHALSVISGGSYGPNPNAIGITNVGQSGFGFIDKLNFANTVNDLEWAVAHNVSHELMHAFGVDVHHDQTGTYIDAGTATPSLLTDPKSTFSPAAAQDILSKSFGRYMGGSSALGAQQIDGDQEILAQPVPEPTTLAFWALAGAGVLFRYRRASRRSAA